MEHVKERITEESRSIGDGETDDPESKHGKEGIAHNSQAGESQCGQKDRGLAHTDEERVDKAGSGSFNLASNSSREETRYFVEQGNGKTLFPDSQTNEDDQRNE